MDTRAFLTIAFLGLACAKDSGGSNAPVAAGPASYETCADYVQRMSPGVRCVSLEASRCQCELPAVAGAGAPPPSSTGAVASTSPSEPQPGPPQGPQGVSSGATLRRGELVFTGAPDNMTVQCLSGPCPTQAAVMVGVAGYPPVSIAGEAATLRLELRAPGHSPMTIDARLIPGANTIPVALERTGAVDPKKATVAFDKAPPGTTVACVSGPCPDKLARPVTDAFPEFSIGQTDRERSVVLQFVSPGFRTESNLYVLLPGRNRIPVELDPVKPDNR